MGTGVRVVQLSPSTANVPPGMSLDEWRTTLTAAANAWNVPCAAVRLEVAPPVQWWRATEDGRTLVVFRRDSWCHNEQCGHLGAFPLRAMGMTSTYPDGARGTAVREADVELNAKTFDFRWNGSEGRRTEGTTWSVPLEPILVHELGHVLGLRDACAESHALGSKKGTDCPLVERKRAMYASALLPQPTERDIAELCVLYPAEGSPIEPAKAGASSNDVPILVVSLAGLVLACALVLQRRRARAVATHPAR